MRKKDYRLIVPAILMALVLWGFVMVRGQAQVTLDVPVVFENVPSGLRITGASGMTVRVSVSGHERFLKGLSPDDIKVTASLEKIKKGEHVHALRRDDIILPGALKVSGLNPSVLNLRIVETSRKDVPVRVVVTGLPAQGYAVSEIRVNPEKVKIEGARNVLRPIELVNTKPVDISSAESNVQTMSDLEMSADLTSSHRKVRVEVVIEKESR